MGCQGSNIKAIYEIANIKYANYQISSIRYSRYICITYWHQTLSLELCQNAYHILSTFCGIQHSWHDTMILYTISCQNGVYCKLQDVRCEIFTIPVLKYSWMFSSILVCPNLIYYFYDHNGLRTLNPSLPPTSPRTSPPLGHLPLRTSSPPGRDVHGGRCPGLEPITTYNLYKSGQYMSYLYALYK